MSESKELVERLRSIDEQAMYLMPATTYAIVREAATLIETQEGLLREAREALAVVRQYVAWYEAAKHAGPWRDHENSAHLKQVDDMRVKLAEQANGK